MTRPRLVQVRGFTRAGGVRVRGHTRRRPEGEVPDKKRARK